MTRLYLTDRDRYRVRYLSGRVVLCIWRDDKCQFETGRGYDRRMVDTDQIAAVSCFAQDGRAQIRWTPFDLCYRAVHRPPMPSPRVWVHPYRRAA